MAFDVLDLRRVAEEEPDRIHCDQSTLIIFEELLTDGTSRLERPHYTLCQVLTKAESISFKRARLFMPDMLARHFYYAEAKRFVFEIDSAHGVYRVLRMSRAYALPSEKNPHERIAAGIELGSICLTAHAVQRMRERFLELHGHEVARPAEEVFRILMKAREDDAIDPAERVKRTIAHGFESALYLRSGPWRFVLQEYGSEFIVLTVEIVNRRL